MFVKPCKKIFLLCNINWTQIFKNIKCHLLFSFRLLEQSYCQEPEIFTSGKIRFSQNFLFNELFSSFSSLKKTYHLVKFDFKKKRIFSSSNGADVKIVLSLLACIAKVYIFHQDGMILFFSFSWINCHVFVGPRSINVEQQILPGFPVYCALPMHFG